MVFPGAFLVTTTLSFNLLGDGLRDASMYEVIDKWVTLLHNRPVKPTLLSPEGASQSTGEQLRDPVRRAGRRQSVKFTSWRVIACMAIIVGVAGVTAVSVPAASRSPPFEAARTWSGGSRRSAGRTASIRPASISANAISIYLSLLIRRLVGYNHVAGAAGNKVVPDLARSIRAPRTAARRGRSR